MCLACEMSAWWFAEMAEAARRDAAAEDTAPADEAARIGGTTPKPSHGVAADDSRARSADSAQRFICEPARRG